MTKPDIWMPLYWGDFLSDTLHLNRAEIGSYMLLIGAYWRRGGPLPDDDEALRMICRCPPQEWMRCRGTMSGLFRVGDGIWTHKRIDRELSDAAERKAEQAARTQKAREAALARGHKPTEPVTESVTDRVTESVTASSSPSPSPSLHTSGAATEIEPPAGFPKSEAEAAEKGKFIGLASDKCGLAYHLAVSRGYTDAKGNTIRNFRSYLQTFATYDRNRQSSGSRNAGQVESGQDLTAAARAKGKIR